MLVNHFTAAPAQAVRVEESEAEAAAKEYSFSSLAQARERNGPTWWPSKYSIGGVSIAESIPKTANPVPGQQTFMRKGDQVNTQQISACCGSRLWNLEKFPQGVSYLVDRSVTTGWSFADWKDPRLLLKYYHYGITMIVGNNGEFPEHKDTDGLFWDTFVCDDGEKVTFAFLKAKTDGDD